MFTNWLTYRVVAEHLDRTLKGRRIGDIYSQDRNELILDIQGDEDACSLHFSANPQSAFLLLRNEFHRARKNTVTLMKETRGAAIESVQIAAHDRMIHIALENGYSLIAVLYATKANLLLYNTTGEQSDSFKKPGQPLEVKDIAFDDAVDVPSIDALLETIRASPESGLPSILKKLRPWLAGTLTEEICRRVNLEIHSLGGTLSPGEIASLHAGMAATLDECCSPPWYVYSRNGLPEAFSLVQLSIAGLDEAVYEDVHEALFDYYKLRERTKRLVSVKTGIMKAIEREMERAKRGLERSMEESGLKSLAGLYEKYANLLMINLERKPEQPGQMTVDDMFDGMGTVISIPLDKKLTVLANSQRYYDKARNTRASIIHMNERRELLAKKKERLERSRALFENLNDYSTLREIMAEQDELMNELGFTSKGEKSTVFPFRRFTVAGGFEVWAGRNSENNDLLTVRNSKPNDLWFHARGVGGSHVVIKVDSAPGAPNKDTIREAAAIAAYYSKHRNANSVPVAYTEKKYVNKPRGVPAGTVTVQREKVIMVRPGLPEGSSEE